MTQISKSKATHRVVPTVLAGTLLLGSIGAAMASSDDGAEKRFFSDKSAGTAGYAMSTSPDATPYVESNDARAHYQPAPGMFSRPAPRANGLKRFDN